MPDKNIRILYISSLYPLKGPGVIGLRDFQRMRNAGLNVDMLTLTQVDGHPEILYVKGHNFLQKAFRYFLYKIKKMLRLSVKQNKHAPFFFFYEKENQPPIPTDRIMKCIKKDYDLVIVYFWQQMLSFETVEAIYDKMHPVVFFFPPDYSHMTGGCHFPGTCKRYQVGCGCCPAIGSQDENDFTHWNVEYRERIYNKVKPVVFGNSYMQEFYANSYLCKNVKRVKSSLDIDTDNYYPVDTNELREQLCIANKDCFIVGFGCQGLTDPRKGISILIESLKLWYQSMSENSRTMIIVVAAGRDFDKIKDSIPFKSIGLGMLPINKLPEFYSLIDIFVCSSVNDAGPSMVGQSIACGTPVVGFEMGALLDLDNVYAACFLKLSLDSIGQGSRIVNKKQ